MYYVILFPDFEYTFARQATYIPNKTPFETTLMFKDENDSGRTIIHHHALTLLYCPKAKEVGRRGPLEKDTSLVTQQSPS